MTKMKPCLLQTSDTWFQRRKVRLGWCPVFTGKHVEICQAVRAWSHARLSFTLHVTIPRWMLVLPSPRPDLRLSLFPSSFSRLFSYPLSCLPVGEKAIIPLACVVYSLFWRLSKPSCASGEWPGCTVHALVVMGQGKRKQTNRVRREIWHVCKLKLHARPAQRTRPAQCQPVPASASHHVACWSGRGVLRWLSGDHIYSVKYPQPRWTRIGVDIPILWSSLIALSCTPRLAGQLWWNKIPYLPLSDVAHELIGLPFIFRRRNCLNGIWTAPIWSRGYLGLP
jgi:hypothetical protein